jgi:hypothetical protein
MSVILKMEKCPAFSLDVNGRRLDCPLYEICARVEFNRVVEDVYNEAPYNFEDNYCEKFLWNGK